MNVTLAKGTVLPLADGSSVTLTQEREITLPRLKFGVMGRPGSGKSKLLASLPKPALYLVTDPEEKLATYFDRCGDVAQSVGQFGQPVWVGMSPKTGKPIMQIEQFYDCDPNNPQAMTNLMARAEQVVHEVNVAQLWASVGLDSWTQAETFAIWRRKTGVFAVKDADAFGRAHGAAYDDLKGVFASRIIPLKCNVGIAFHTTEMLKEEGGVSFFGIKAGGKDLPTQLASLLPERYRSVAQPDGVSRIIYTRPDGRFDLCTLISAPNPCANEYQALFSNWIAQKAKMLEDNAQCVSAAQPAAGDSSAATQESKS